MVTNLCLSFRNFHYPDTINFVSSQGLTVLHSFELTIFRAELFSNDMPHGAAGTEGTDWISRLLLH